MTVRGMSLTVMRDQGRTGGRSSCVRSTPIATENGETLKPTQRAKTGRLTPNNLSTPRRRATLAPPRSPGIPASAKSFRALGQGRHERRRRGRSIDKATGHSCQLWSSRIAQQSIETHAARGGCEAIEWRGRSQRARPIREAASASLRAPLRPVPVPVDPADASEEPEASARRRILQYDNRKTNARPARSS